MLAPPKTFAGTEVFDGASNRSPSTCLKTPQHCSKEGRLKPFFANNVDISFARARQVKCATSCRNTCTSTSCASKADAVPAESNGTQWKTTQRVRRVL